MTMTPSRPMLRGPRLLLRPAERSDIDAFVRWFNDADVVENLKPRAPMGRAAEERWFESLLEQQGRDVHHFVIALRDGGEAIGGIGLHAVDPIDGSAELGIVIGERSRWDQGLGTEAAEVLLDYAFGELRLERVQLHVFEGNARARRSYVKLGFRHEGTLRHALYRHGRHRDVEVMSILREEWAAQSRTRSWDRD